MNLKPPKTRGKGNDRDLLCVSESTSSSLAALGMLVLLSGLRSWSPGCTTTKITTEQTEEFQSMSAIPF